MMGQDDVWIGDGADVIVYRKGSHPLLTVSEAIARYAAAPAVDAAAEPADVMARIHHLNALVDEIEFTLTHDDQNLVGQTIGSGVEWGERWLCILHWLAEGSGPFPAHPETMMVQLLTRIRGSVGYRYETVGGELGPLWDRLRFAELAARKEAAEGIPQQQAA